jgi:hypothetical protein
VKNGWMINIPARNRATKDLCILNSLLLLLALSYSKTEKRIVMAQGEEPQRHKGHKEFFLPFVPLWFFLTAE